MATNFNDVVSNANMRQAQLLAMNSDIDAEVHTIIASAKPGVGLSRDDIVRVQDLRTSQTAILTSIQELALLTAAALDDSDTLEHITASLASALQVLKSETAAIAAVKAHCAEIANVCAGLDDLLGKLKNLAG